MTYIILVKGGTTMTYYHTVWWLPIKYHLRHKAKSSDHKKIDHYDLHCFRAKPTLHWLIITKHNFQTSYSLQDIRQNHWTIKYVTVIYIYFEVECRVILTHNPEVWCSYIKQSSRYKAKSLTMKYGSQWPTFIFKVKCCVILTHNPEVWCSYIKQSSRYAAKSLDHEI